MGVLTAIFMLSLTCGLLVFLHAKLLLDSFKKNFFIMSHNIQPHSVFIHFRNGGGGGKAGQVFFNMSKGNVAALNSFFPVINCTQPALL